MCCIRCNKKRKGIYIMKIVVIRSPKALQTVLRVIFGIKKTEL
ncbi:MAG: stage V sporulation protein SpoVM [Clostridia bacterium]|nr:stage V sporulation protein SpoVM [Clostridia bacterium]